VVLKIRNSYLAWYKQIRPREIRGQHPVQSCEIPPLSLAAHRSTSENINITYITKECGRWGAARYGAVLAVEYGQTKRTAVAMVTRSPGARRQGFLMTPAKYVTYIRKSTNQHLEILIIRLTLTQLLCPVTLTFDPLTLKLVHGVLVS